MGYMAFLDYAQVYVSSTGLSLLMFLQYCKNRNKNMINSYIEFIAVRLCYMDSMLYWIASINKSRYSGVESDERMRFPHMDVNSNANGFDDHMVKPQSEPLLSYADCELPEIPKITTNGQYFEFEQIANGVDGYFDGNSDTDDENFGGFEDNSFTFGMCRVRRFRRSSKSPPEIYPRKRLGNGRTM
ncbi:unnamed protein product, partial [Wuchereria bancrofti]